MINPDNQNGACDQDPWDDFPPGGCHGSDCKPAPKPDSLGSMIDVLRKSEPTILGMSLKDDIAHTFYAYNHGINCKKCGTYSQVWIQRDTLKWTCHRVGCQGNGGLEQDVIQP